jgi:hypothetical protein
MADRDRRGLKMTNFHLHPSRPRTRQRLSLWSSARFLFVSDVCCHIDQTDRRGLPL